MEKDLTQNERENTSINLVYCLGERSVVSEEIGRIFLLTKAFFAMQSSCHMKLSDCSLAFKVNHK